MGETVRIRQAEIADCDAIGRVLHESFAEFRDLYTEEGFAATTPGAEQVRDRMREGPVWVALRDSAIVGTVAALKNRDSAYVRGMAVLPSVRGSGVAALLLQQVEGWAAAENICRLFLSTAPFLGSAIRLYEKSGFQRTAQGPDDLFGTPLFTMEKVIRK